MINFGNDVHFVDNILEEVSLPDLSFLGSNVHFIGVIGVLNGTLNDANFPGLNRLMDSK